MDEEQLKGKVGCIFFVVVIIFLFLYGNIAYQSKRTDAQPANGCYKNFAGNYVCP